MPVVRKKEWMVYPNEWEKKFSSPDTSDYHLHISYVKKWIDIPESAHKMVYSTIRLWNHFIVIIP